MPSTLLKAVMVRAVEVKAWPVAGSVICQAPVITIARAVIEQVTMVSMKVPVMPISPWRAGSAVLAAEWASDPVPSPASLEKMPRATPNWIPLATAAPAKPPAAAWPEKALWKIRATAWGRALDLAAESRATRRRYK